MKEKVKEVMLTIGIFTGMAGLFCETDNITLQVILWFGSLALMWICGALYCKDVPSKEE